MHACACIQCIAMAIFKMTQEKLNGFYVVLIDAVTLIGKHMTRRERY